MPAMAVPVEALLEAAPTPAAVPELVDAHVVEPEHVPRLITPHATAPGHIVTAEPE